MYPKVFLVGIVLGIVFIAGCTSEESAPVTTTVEPKPTTSTVEPTTSVKAVVATSSVPAMDSCNNICLAKYNQTGECVASAMQCKGTKRHTERDGHDFCREENRIYDVCCCVAE